jgi:hypothetical protein
MRELNLNEMNIVSGGGSFTCIALILIWGALFEITIYLEELVIIAKQHSHHTSIAAAISE